MKSFLAILLIVGLIGGAAVSLLIMDHHNGNCAASSAAGVACPLQLSALAFFGIHINFFRSFSEALLAAVFLFFLLSLALSAPYISNFGDFDLKLGFSRNLFIEVDNNSKHKLIFWLSLFENSPALS